MWPTSETETAKAEVTSLLLTYMCHGGIGGGVSDIPRRDGGTTLSTLTAAY